MTDENLSVEKIVIPTSVREQPSTDFITILTKKTMQDLKLKNNGYVTIENKLFYDYFSWSDIFRHDFLKKEIFEKIFPDENTRKNKKIQHEREENRLKKFLEKIFHQDFDSFEIRKTDHFTILVGNSVVVLKLNLLTNTVSIKLKNQNKELETKKTKDNLVVGETRFMNIDAQVIDTDHPNSLLKEDEKLSDEYQKLDDNQVGIDQTYREALGLDKGENVKVIPSRKKFGLIDRIFTYLNYQKAVVRVQQNGPYMEAKIPVVCLCEEILNSIGANYGDKIIIETSNGLIPVKCAQLSNTMLEFHNFILNPPTDSEERIKEKIRFEKTYLISPMNLLKKFGRISEKKGDLIHPIFMDAISRRKAGIKPLDCIKIRKSFGWETVKKLNTFGSLAGLAIAVMIPEILANPNELSFLWFAVAPLSAMVIWSIFSASKYNTSGNGF